MPAVDVKTLHAKIGGADVDQRFFIPGALSKAGLLSAKR